MVGREIDEFIIEVIFILEEKLIKVMVNEFGVLIYFVFKVVIEEFFDLDIMVWGVISIGRCL